MERPVLLNEDEDVERRQKVFITVEVSSKEA